MKFTSLIAEFKDSKDKDGNLQTQEYISMGRLCFWILFIFMIYFWFRTPNHEVPKTMYDVFYLMVLYNFFKKPLDTLKGTDFKEMFKHK